MNDRSQPRAVHLTDPLAPIAPHPYPGCDVCGALLKEWVSATEPASPLFSDSEARRISSEINLHRRQDEAQAPAL